MLVVHRLLLTSAFFVHPAASQISSEYINMKETTIHYKIGVVVIELRSILIYIYMLIKYGPFNVLLSGSSNFAVDVSALDQSQPQIFTRTVRTRV